MATPPRIVCRYCADEGERSSVTPLGGSRWLMASSPWYDENGVYHEHDPNRQDLGYRCSRGHLWVERSFPPCPNCGERAGETTVERLDGREER